MSHLDYYNTIKDINDMIHENNVRLLEKVCIELNAVDRIDELKEKFMDSSFTKIKAKKDPNKPKRPLTCYTLFCNEIRDDLMKKHPELNFSEINKELGKKWNELENKQKYIEKAQEAKNLYCEKLEVYNKEHGII